MIGPLQLAGLLALLLITWAVSGPAVIARSSAALSRAPRAAVAFLVATGGLWFLALTTVALVLAWSAAGPALLPGRAAEVCQRCIEAASPFGTPTGTFVPPGVPLLAAVALTGGLVARALVRARRRWRTTAQEVDEHLRETVTTTVLGHRVHILDDGSARAFSLPTHQGGIAVTRGALDLLETDALAAVLAHEAAHVDQRHHLQVALVRALYAPLSWIPLFRTIVETLPIYLEIAADDAARRAHGTDALATALLQLSVNAGAHRAPEAALHAAGPHRVRHLVDPEPARRGLLALGIGLGQLAAVGSIGLGVLGIYLLTFVAGCAI